MIIYKTLWPLDAAIIGRGQKKFATAFSFWYSCLQMCHNHMLSPKNRTRYYWKCIWCWWFWCCLSLGLFFLNFSKDSIFSGLFHSDLDRHLCQPSYTNCAKADYSPISPLTFLDWFPQAWLLVGFWFVSVLSNTLFFSGYLVCLNQTVCTFVW